MTSDGNTDDSIEPNLGEPQDEAVETVAKTDLNEWMQTMYQVAWEQYAHEDQLRHSKNALYITIQTALIWLIPTSAALLHNLSPFSLFGRQIDQAWLLFGLIGLISSGLGFRVAYFWSAVIRSGRAWMYVRLASVHQIEHEAGIGRLGLSHIEHEWEKYSKSNPAKRAELDAKGYSPFSDIPQLQDFLIHPQGSIGESGAVLGMIRYLRVVWTLVAILSLAVFIASFFLLGATHQAHHTIPHR